MNSILLPLCLSLVLSPGLGVERPVANRAKAVPLPEKKEDNLKSLDPQTAELPERPPIRFKRLFTLEAKESRGSGLLTFSPDGRLLAAAWGGGRTVRWQGADIEYAKADVGIWDVQKRTLLHVLPHPERNIAAIAFVPPGDRIVTACSDLNKVFLWDVKSGKLLETLDTGGNATYTMAVTGLAAFPDGKRVLCCAFTGLIVWDLCNKNQKTLPLEEYVPPGPHDLPAVPKHCFKAAFTADGSRFATTVWDSRFATRILIWDAKSFGVTGVIPVQRLGQEFAYAPDGNSLAAGYHRPGGQGPGEIGVWDTASRKLVLSGQLFEWGTLNLTFAGDSKYLIACGAQIDRSRPSGGKPAVGVWELASGKLVSRLPPGESAAVSPDNRRLALGGRFIDIFAIEHAEQRKSPPGGQVNAKP